MKFYGVRKYIKNRYIRNLKFKFLKKTRRIMHPKNNLPSASYRIYSIVIPSNWNTILTNNLLNKNVFFVYNSVYFFYIPMPVYGSVIRVDNNASVLSFTTMYSTNFFRVYWSHLTKIFNSFNKPFFKKLRFKGKGYYIFKNIRQTITPQFGHSHRLYLYAYFASVIFLSKTHIFLFGFLKNDIVNLSYKIKEMRSINIFTGRGVRFSRQIIYKKTGKVSSYR